MDASVIHVVSTDGDGKTTVRRYKIMDEDIEKPLISHEHPFNVRSQLEMIHNLRPLNPIGVVPEVEFWI